MGPTCGIGLDYGTKSMRAAIVDTNLTPPEFL
jgi:ribulose kinase